MASFFHQLKVLLWKNWLSVYRQPVWSVVLVFFPVVIFFIMAVTRTKFAPTQASDCYLAPRSLQSTGMIPFLQSFLCETDTKCSDKSYIPNIVTTRSRLKKRFADSGGGGSAFQSRNSTNQTATSCNSTMANNWTAAVEIINTGKLVMQDISSGDLKGALCSTISLYPPAQQITLQRFCQSNETLARFAMGALFSQASNTSSMQILSLVNEISTKVEVLQSNTDLWNFLLMLPEYLKNPQSFVYSGEFVLNFSTVPHELSYIQPCVKSTLKILSQVITQSATNVSNILQTLSNQTLATEMKSCISLFQLLPCGSSYNCLAVEQTHTFHTIYWLVTSLTKENSSIACKYDFANWVCNGSINWDFFLESSLTLIKEAIENSSTTLTRYVQKTWTLLKQNNVNQIIVEKLQQEINNTYPLDPQLPSILREMVYLLLNTTDVLITQSYTDQYFLFLKTILARLETLVPQELLSVKLGSNTGLIINITESIINDIQYWIHLSDLLSSSNVSLQTLVELQAIIKTLSNTSTEVVYEFTKILQILSVFNQTIFQEFTQTLQNLPNLNLVTSNITAILNNAITLFSDIIGNPKINNSFVLSDFYLKKILQLLNSDTTMQNALGLLNPYFNFIQAGNFSRYAAILTFFTPSNLQAVGSSPNNASLAVLNLISGFIPAENQQLFNKVEHFLKSLLDSVSTCQLELTECSSSILRFQQQLNELIQFISSVTSGDVQNFPQLNQLSGAEIKIINDMFSMILCSQAHINNDSCNNVQDIYGELIYIINMTLKTDPNFLSIYYALQPSKQNIESILHILGSVDLPKLISKLDYVISLSKCYTDGSVDPLKCTLDLSLNLMDLLHLLPFPLPINGTLFAASSVIENWISGVNRTVDVYKQLNNMYDLTNLAYQNHSVIQQIETTLQKIVQTLEELNINSTSLSTASLIGDLLENLNFANVNVTFSTSLVSQIKQELENINIQLQTIQWYILFVKNEMETFYTPSSINGFVKLIEFLINNALSVMKSNPSLVPIVNEIQSLISWMEKSHIVPALQNMVNMTLQDGGHVTETFINNITVAIQQIIQQEFASGSPWNQFLNQFTDSEAKFVLQLLQEYGRGGLNNLSSVMLLTEKVLLAVESLLKDMHINSTFNYNVQDIYNISHQVLGLVYNAESGLNRSVLYDVYNSLLDSWSGSIFYEFPLLKTKLMDLLYSSMHCLTDSTMLSLKQNCSSTDITYILQLILKDLGCQKNLQSHNINANVTLFNIFEYALNITWEEHTNGCAIENPNTKEELACLVETLASTIQLISTINNLSGINRPWVQEIDGAIALVTNKLSTNNITCAAKDIQIMYKIYQAFDNQSSHFQSLISAFMNQAELYSKNPSEYSKYLLQIFDILKLYDSMHEQILLNETIVNFWYNTVLQLLEVTQNHPTRLLLVSSMLNTVSNISTYFRTTDYPREFLHLLNIVNSVLNLTDVTVTLNASLPHVSLVNIFDGNFYIINNLLKQLLSDMNITSTESCENSLQSLISLYHNKMNLPINDMFYYNFSIWSCSLILSNNLGFNWLEEMKSMASMIFTSESGLSADFAMKIITSFTNFVNNTNMNTFETFMASITEFLQQKEPTMNLNVYQIIQELQSSLQATIKEVMLNSSALNDDMIVVSVMEALTSFFRSLNITGYKEIIIFASDVLQIYINNRNSALPLDNLAQKVLGGILTSFQESGLEKIVVQVLENQIFTQPSEEKKLLHYFMNIVMSAIKETLALQALSFNNNLVFNIIKNTLELFSTTTSQEILNGNTNLTIFIASIVKDILQSAENWKNISVPMSFPKNGSDQILNDLENLVNRLISQSIGNKELYVNYSSTIVKLFYIFFTGTEKTQAMQSLQQALDSIKPTKNAPALVSTLEILYDFIHLNNTNSGDVIKLYIRQLENFIRTSQIKQYLSEIGLLLNTTEKLPLFQSSELRDVALAILPYLYPPLLYNISNNSKNITSVLLNLFSMNILLGQQQSTKNITENFVLLLEKIDKCSNHLNNCIGAISGFETLAMDAISALLSIRNGSIDIKISNEMVMEFEKLTGLQVSFINSVFITFWNAQKDIYNFTGDFTDAYQEVIRASQLILNITGYLNATLPEQDLEMLQNYLQKITIIHKVISNSNITQSLLQLQNIQIESQCENQTLICTLNLTCNLLKFIQNLKEPSPLMEHILVVSTIIDYWKNELNTTGDMYQQMTSLYNITKAVLQNEPVLNRIHIAVKDISKIIEDIRNNMSSLAIEEQLLSFLDLLKKESSLNSFNNTLNLSSTQLDHLETRIQLIHWYIMYVKNQTESPDMSVEVYALYRLTQVILADMIPDIQSLLTYNMTGLLTANLLSHQSGTLFQLLRQMFTGNQSYTTVLSQLENWINATHIFNGNNPDLNTSTIPEFTTIWQVMNSLMDGKLNTSQLEEILKAVERALSSQNITVGSDTFHLYELFVGIFNQTTSDGPLNLTHMLHSFLAKDCEGISKVINSVYKKIQMTSASTIWPVDTMFSNLTVDMCHLLQGNYSQINWINILHTSREFVVYLTPLVPDSVRKHFTVAEYIIEVATDLIIDPTISQSKIASIMSILPVINKLFNNISSSNDWAQNTIFQKLIYFLVDLAWTSSSDKDLLLLKTQNVFLEVIQDIQNMLKLKSGSPYDVWISFALDVVGISINTTQNSSLHERFLNKVWDSFKQNGLENVVISTISHLWPTSGTVGSENAYILETFLQLVFNITDMITSNIQSNVTTDIIGKAMDMALILLAQNKNNSDIESASNSFTLLSPNNSIDALKTVVENILTAFLPQTENAKLMEILQTVLNVTKILLEVTNQDTISKLEMFVKKLAFQFDISSNPGTLINMLSSLNQTDLISQIVKLVKSFIASDNLQNINVYLDALNLFNNLVQLNGTINIQDISTIMTRYLPIYMDASNQTQSALKCNLNLLQYLLNSIDTRSSDFSKVVIEILPLFQSHVLLNESIDIHNLSSWLVGLISQYLQPTERDTFERAANATLLLIQSMQACSATPMMCTGLIDGVQNFVSDVKQLDFVLNGTLINSSLLNFESYNQSQITVINEVFLMLSYATGYSFEASTDGTGLYENILTLTKWLLNTTMKDTTNTTTSTVLKNILNVLTSTNITQLLLQTENLMHSYICTNQTDIDLLVCKLNVTFQLTHLLQLVPLAQSTQDNLGIIYFIAEQWLTQLNSNLSVSQQLADLYNTTMLALQYHHPVLQAINTSLLSTITILKDMGIFSFSLNTTDLAISILSDVIQKVDSEIKMYTHTDVLQYNISNILENIKFQLDTVNWLLLWTKSKAEGFSSSAAINEVSTAAKWLTNISEQISFILKDFKSLSNTFNSTCIVTDLLQVFNVTVPSNLIQGLIWQAGANIQSFRNISFIRDLLMNQSIQKDAEIALLLLQEMNVNNISSILTSINQVLQTIQGVQGLDLAYQFYSNTTIDKIFTIVKKGMGILNDIAAKGTIGKETIYEIYNFTYLLVQDEWNWVPFQNISAMEAELLDVVYMVMKPFLGGNWTHVYTGNCSAQDVLQILVQTIFKNATSNMTLEKTTCDWQLIYSSSEISSFSNHSLGDMIYLALQSSPVFHNVCSKDSLHPLAEEIACLMQVMGISMNILAHLNKISGLQIPLIQSLSDSLAFICNNMPAHNSIFQQETQLLNTLHFMFLNESNPVHVFIQFLIDHYSSPVQITDLQQIWTEISKIINVLASKDSSLDAHINELVAAAVNMTVQPSWFGSWQALNKLLSMNWTAVNIDVSLSVLDQLRRALILIDSGLDIKTIQVYQAIVSLLRNPSFTSLFDMKDSSLMNTTMSSTSECTSVLSAVAKFFDSVWAASDPTHSYMDEGLLSNFSLLTCGSLHLQSANISTWILPLETFKSILPYLATNMSADIVNYITGLEKIIVFVSDAMNSLNISQEIMLGGVYKLFIQELKIFSNDSIIADWIGKIPVNQIISSFTNNITVGQIIAIERDFLYSLSGILNATSYSAGFSMLSDLVSSLSRSAVSQHTATGLNQQLLNLMIQFTVTVQILPLAEPYGTVMKCLKNVTQDLSSNLNGHLEEAIQLAQDLFTQSNESANASAIPDLLKQKIYQLQNLSNIICGLEGSNNSLSYCYMPCQYLSLLQNVGTLLSAGAKVTQTATSSPAIITSLLSSLWQAFENEISVQLNTLLPVNDLTNITTALSQFINVTSPSFQAILANIFRNSSHVEEQLSQIVKLSQTSITALMNVLIPDDKTQIGTWITTLYHCSTNTSLVAQPFQVYCNLSPEQGYQMVIIFLENVDFLKLMYRLAIPSTWQASFDLILTTLKTLIDKVDSFLNDMPSEGELTNILKLIKTFTGLSTTRRRRRTVDPLDVSGSTRATIPSVTTLSKIVCTGNLTLLSQVLYSMFPLTKSARNRNSERAQTIFQTFGIPTDNAFCSELFVNLVQTTTGAGYWTLLKPLLYGQILYAPNNALTQKIMEKTNSRILQMEDYKNTVQNISNGIKRIQDNWPFIQLAQKLFGKVQELLNNTALNAILQDFLSLNVTDLSEKLNKAESFINLIESNIYIIQIFQNICDVLLNLMSCMSYNRIQPMNSAEEMMAKADELQKTNNLFAAVTFNLSGSSRQKRALSNLPKQISYSISMRSLLSESTDSISSNWVPGPRTSLNKYSRGFVYLQENIDRAIIEMQTNKNLDDIAVQFQPMPYPCYTKDSFLYSMAFSLPIALMISWVLFIASFVKKLVHEKELGLHEYMKMMGVNSCSHFFAWLIESASFLILSVSILVLILKVGKVLAHSNGFILFLFFLDYSLTVIAMSFLISVFFHNTNVAGLSGSLIYIISFFPFIVVVSKQQTLSFAGKTFLSLFSPTALSYATQYIVRFEEQDEGIQWHNMYTSPLGGDSFNFGWLCWMMLIDSMIYFIIGWYIKIVFPGKYGIGAPWYFPVQPSFWMECCGFHSWCSRKPSGLLMSNIVAHGVPEKKGDELYPYNEQDPVDLTLGVSLHGLTKVYRSKVAVKNLNLNFYEGHITALLGHNGAGKTTTLSMLTGLFSATSGTINVYGEDIRTRLHQVRKNLGVCMQYDVLFDHLTTKEHLLLYGSIKAPKWNKIQLYEEVKRTLNDTGLYNHRHKPVKTLSGGMRRKLSICIALIGGSKVVVLDEPTTGVDPCSRRSIWEVISKNKKDKTIILSTHHLDEAEVLSDRIAFLEQGGLRCCGTPMFLKEKFGSGYNLTLTKKFPNQKDDKVCDSAMVTALIQSHIPAATLKEDVGGELVYVLPPFRAEISNAYLSLLRDLDANLNELCLGCYGISDTTIEEVFLKLTDGLDEDDNTFAQRAVPIPNSQGLVMEDESSSRSYSFSDRDDQPLTQKEKVKGVKLFFKKIGAIFIKRFHNSKRNWKGLLSQILLPVLFVIAAMGLASLSTSSVEYPKLLLTPELYGTTQQAVVFGINNESSERLMDAMSSFPGIDNFCIDNRAQCLTENSLGSWNYTGDQMLTYDKCNCTAGITACGSPDITPPHRMTFSKQMMYNITGKNMENYLIATTLQYIQKRYGGWSFGLPTSQMSSFLPLPENLTLNKVWYNNEGPHSLPAFLNSFNNFLLRANLPSNEAAQYGISVYSQPLPGTVAQSAATSTLVNTLVALSVLIGYSITTASFVTYVVKEYDNGSKRLQHIAGVGEVLYWITNFLYDLTIYLIPVGLSIAMIAAFKFPAFYNYPNLGAVSLLFILFGYATFSWMYLIAGTFKNAGMAFITYVGINLFIGINTIISSSVVYLLIQQKSPTDTNYQSQSDTYNVLINFFKIFPQFSFGYGLIMLSQQQAIQEQYAIYGSNEKVDIFRMDILGYMFVAMTVQGTFCFLLRLLINDGIIYSIKTFFKKLFKLYPIYIKDPDEEEDVKAERERVDSGNATEDLLVLKGLTKVFHSVNKQVYAVNNMSLGIPPGECFGLLGVNGAGKTTTFKMLTGDTSPSSGDIQVRDLMGSLEKVLGFNTDWSSFGYCPQEDALDELMTGLEHLYYYARIHGIPERRIKSVTNQLLQKLQLVQYKNRVTASYSCGTRRKLSTALALIGRPSILLMDEPSSGMDPKTKRHLWKIISEEIREKCAVVLTSHSMEECEALCTRIAIMVKGKFQCLGSLQHVKSRFGSGFTVKMHLKDSSVSIETITDFMHSHFPNTYLKEQHFTMVEYHVPMSVGGVASIFDLLESRKTVLNIIHFSVSQTTLDEVFINFAQAQSSSDNASLSNTSSQDFRVVVA